MEGKKKTQKIKNSNKTEKIKEDKPKKYKPDFRKLKKLTKAQKEGLRLLAKNPDATMKDISMKLIDKGMVKDPEYLAIQKNQNKVIAQEIEQIKTENARFLHSQLVPKAGRIAERVLDDKKIKDSKKFSWVKLAFDSGYKDEAQKRPIMPIQVNIKQLQAVISRNISEDQPFNQLEGNDINESEEQD